MNHFYSAFVSFLKVQCSRSWKTVIQFSLWKSWKSSGSILGWINDNRISIFVWSIPSKSWRPEAMCKPSLLKADFLRMGPNISEYEGDAIFKVIPNPEHPKEAVKSTVWSQYNSDHITSVILFLWTPPAQGSGDGFRHKLSPWDPAQESSQI